jgi:hypothetical protein
MSLRLTYVQMALDRELAKKVQRSWRGTSDAAPFNARCGKSKADLSIEPHTNCANSASSSSSSGTLPRRQKLQARNVPSLHASTADTRLAFPPAPQMIPVNSVTVARVTSAPQEAGGAGGNVHALKDAMKKGKLHAIKNSNTPAMASRKYASTSLADFEVQPPHP